MGAMVSDLTHGMSKYSTLRNGDQQGKFEWSCSLLYSVRAIV